MEQLQKSLELLDKYFNETPEEEIKKNLEYFDRLDFEGPTWNEYVGDFEREYEDIYSYEINIPVIDVNPDRNSWRVDAWESNNMELIFEDCSVEIENFKTSTFSIKDHFAIAA